jgi:hypothetical protein
MSDYANGQWATGAAFATAEPEPLAPVLTAIAPPARQSRVTVLLRFLLAIPHYIVLYAIGIAAFLVLVIGWFAALFKGRLPDFAAEFLTAYLRWQVRVMAYTFLLTDEYPPFAMGDAAYPVRIAVRPGRLNRLAVLFRYFLLIPVVLLNVVVAYGALTVMGFVSWLIVLVAGQMPAALHQALSAVVRYNTRVLGFQSMLTSAYPMGLFGDKLTTDAFGEPVVTEPDPWHLVLSDAARRLVVFYIVFGVVLLAGGFSAGVAIGFSNVNLVTNQQAANTIQADFSPVENSLNGYGSRVQSCHQQFSCLAAPDRSLGGQLTTFGGQLRSIQVSGSQATQALSTLEQAATRAADAFSTEGAATSATAYNSGLAALQSALTSLSDAYNNVGTALGVA